MHRPARYNAKARQGGTHKKGKSAKRKSTTSAPATEAAPAHIPGQAEDRDRDANADVLERKSVEEKEADRRLKLRQQVRLSLLLMRGVRREC